MRFFLRVAWVVFVSIKLQSVTIHTDSIVIQAKSAQDRVSVISDSLLDQHHYFLADGHGPRGDWAAEYAVNNLPLHFDRLRAEQDLSASEAMKLAIKAADKHLLRNRSPSHARSGTTVVWIYINENILHLLTLGDSRALMIRNTEATLSFDQPILEHSADLAHEQIRVKSEGDNINLMGCISHVCKEIKSELPVICAKNEELQTPCQPLYRVNSYTRFTRSLGDKVGKAIIKSLNANPEIVVMPLEEIKGFVLMSDGIFERGINGQVSNQDIFNSVAQAIDKSQPHEENAPQLAATDISEMAQNAQTNDDLSVVVGIISTP